MREVFKPIKTLNSRLFKKNKGRNMVAVLAILLTTLMFTTLFTLAQSMSRNMIEMTFRQTGYDAQASFKSITDVYKRQGHICVDIIHFYLLHIVLIIKRKEAGLS